MGTQVCSMIIDREQAWPPWTHWFMALNDGKYLQPCPLLSHMYPLQEKLSVFTFVMYLSKWVGWYFYLSWKSVWYFYLSWKCNFIFLYGGVLPVYRPRHLANTSIEINYCSYIYTLICIAKYFSSIFYFCTNKVPSTDNHVYYYCEKSDYFFTLLLLSLCMVEFVVFILLLFHNQMSLWIQKRKNCVCLF
jgi:hypothetical protein